MPWKPDKAVEIVVGSTPGGGNDRTARTLQRIWQDGNAVAHHQSSAMRIIAISTAKRSAGLPDVPTLKEQGFDVVMGGWIVMMGPKGLSPAQVAYWEGVLERTTGHAQWKRYLEEGSLEGQFLPAEPSREYLKREYEVARALLTEMGMVK